MPANTRKRRRKTNEDGPPIPAALIPAKKKAKKEKKIPPQQGKKRKDQAGFNEPKTKKAKRKTPSKTEIQSTNRLKLGEKPDAFVQNQGFVDPLIFNPAEPKRTTPVPKKTTAVPPSSVPPRVAFQVTPKTARSPIKRRVTPFPRKQNTLIIPKKKTRRGSFRRVTKEEIRRSHESPNSENGALATPKEPAATRQCNCTRVKSACGTCWKLILAIIICACVFPLFLIDNPLTSSQAFLQSRLESELVKELRKEKGLAECNQKKLNGLSKTEAQRFAKNHFGKKFQDDLIERAIEEIIRDKDNDLDYDGEKITTRAAAIKSSKCLKDEEQIERIRKATINHLRIKEGSAKCKALLFQEYSKDNDRLQFPISDIRQEVFDSKFSHMPLHSYEKLFNRMQEKISTWFGSSELKLERSKDLEGLDIYTTLEPRYSLACKVELWFYSNKLYILGFVAVVLMIGYAWHSTRTSTRVAKEVDRVFADVIQHLENKSRLISTWVPIQYVHDLVDENCDRRVWAAVEQKVAKSNHINKGVEMVDGMEQKCWKVKLHHS